MGTYPKTPPVLSAPADKVRVLPSITIAGYNAGAILPRLAAGGNGRSNAWAKSGVAANKKQIRKRRTHISNSVR